MKTFSDLTIIDTIYLCDKNGIRMRQFDVTVIINNSNSSYINYAYDTTLHIKDWDVSFIETRDGYVFCDQSEATRYSKLQNVKHLRELISEAKKAINKVKEFRIENFESLNKNWLESDIKELEFFRTNN